MPAAKKSASSDEAKGTENAVDEQVVVAGVASPTIRRADAPFSTRQQLMPSAAPDPQMVKVKEVATGRVFAAWPVDARELVTHPNQEHEYAAAEDDLSPTNAFRGNPTPVAPTNSNTPIGTDPVSVAAPVIAGRGVDAATAEQQLGEKSKTELQELARRAGIDENQSQKDLAKALQPHVVAGTVSLGGPQPLAPKPPTPR
jgi:hypothetical protein